MPINDNNIYSYAIEFHSLFILDLWIILASFRICIKIKGGDISIFNLPQYSLLVPVIFESSGKII